MGCKWTAFALVLAVLLEAGGARAATFTATKNADTNDGACDADCSLREAIIAANASAGTDEVIVPPGTYTLTIIGPGEDAGATGDLDITDDLTLAGAGADTTIIDGNATDRVFDVRGDIPTVAISGVTIQNGSVFTAWGGGIFINAGTLTLSHSTVSGNTASGGGGICNGDTLTLTHVSVRGNTATNGGGIANAGIAVLTNTTVSGNTAVDPANPFSGGGGIANDATGSLSLTNSTVSGNMTNHYGGGIASQGTVELTNSTVSANTATNGGGMVNGGTVTLTNSIVAANVPDNCFFGVVSSRGHNMDDDDTCRLTDPTDLPGVPNAGMGPLADNGGSTETHALLATSPAIDAGDDAFCPPTDQRAAPRVDGDGNGVPTCDIGAVEFQPMCVGGADAGQPCVTNEDCRDACVGGAEDGNPCPGDQPCPDGCVGGGRDGKPCKPGGSPKCKPGCVGGFRDGRVCRAGAQCPGACSGGTNDRNPCLMGMDCPGGACVAATCQDSHGCVDLALGCADIGVCLLASPSWAFLDPTGSLVE